MEKRHSDADSLDVCPKRVKTEEHDYNLKINAIYQEYADLLSDAFCKRKTVDLENEAKVISDPFTCCVLPNFIQPQDYLEELKHELSELDMQLKMNDLYEFEQSEDLGDLSLPNILKFKKFLSEEVLVWLRKITKIPLTEKIDISCSCYSCSDHLLCHDDELEGRRIAYIFYLVPEWSESDGGSLDLFNTVDNQPSEICKSFIPKWNNFIFFEVSPVSYHQVSEVLTTKKRITLSGWFHGPPRKSSVPIAETILFKEPTTHLEIDITEWISPMYLEGQIQLDISETFEDNSELSLASFFKYKKYEEICSALMEYKMWEKKGPANYRNMYEANNDNLPQILKECQALFSSEAFLLILSNLTGLKLHPACDDDAKLGKAFCSFRKWCPGTYTLLHDQSFTMTCLIVIMHFNCSEWIPEYGGYSCFVASGESDELLRIEPYPNCLAVIYKTDDISHFVKYVNNKAKDLPFFHEFYGIYIEDDADSDKTAE